MPSQQVRFYEVAVLGARDAETICTSPTLSGLAAQIDLSKLPPDQGIFLHCGGTVQPVTLKPQKAILVHAAGRSRKDPQRRLATHSRFRPTCRMM
ncbi:MAG: hypothetical protein EYC62_00280 [Alphaproteobacteria bacterium]|nr:MAG: hypothetical protein EYC62_00280 [Alphaproteobacteria bacterium]